MAFDFARYWCFHEEFEDSLCPPAIDVDAKVMYHDAKSFTRVDRTSFFGQEMACVGIVEDKSIDTPELLKYIDFGRLWTFSK